MNGKGDKMRPFNGPAYRENFDRIFRKKKKKPAYRGWNFSKTKNPIKMEASKDGWVLNPEYEKAPPLTMAIGDNPLKQYPLSESSKRRAELMLPAETFENDLPKGLIKKSTKQTP